MNLCHLYPDPAVITELSRNKEFIFVHKKDYYVLDSVLNCLKKLKADPNPYGCTVQRARIELMTSSDLRKIRNRSVFMIMKLNPNVLTVYESEKIHYEFMKK